MSFHLGDFEETEVRRRVVLTSCQGDSFLGASAGLHAGGQAGVRAAGRGKHLLLFHLHDVVPGGKVVEEIRSAGIGGREREDRFSRFQFAVVVGVAVKRDHSIRHSNFTSGLVLNLVAIEVIPKVIANAAAVVVAKVGGQHIHSCAQRHILQSGTVGPAADQF